MFPYCISLMTPKENSIPFVLLRPASSLGCQSSAAPFKTEVLASKMLLNDNHLSGCSSLPSVFSELQS